MENERDYEFEVGTLAVSCLFTTPADDAVLLERIELALEAVIAALPERKEFETPHELSILICGSEEIAELNAQWRGKSYATNVLSFPAPQEMDAKLRAFLAPLGDIAIALPVCFDEVQQMGIEYQDHFSHLIVHGVLHLLGYDHEYDAQANAMETLETRILKSLAIADPYENDRCRPLLHESKH